MAATWWGCNRKSIITNRCSIYYLSQIKPNMQILFNWKTASHSKIEPYPRTHREKNIIAGTVILPYSGSNRWYDIKRAMDVFTIKNVHQLYTAIKSYNSRVQRFKLLERFFDVCSNEERTHFFNKVLPKMRKMMINMPHIVTLEPKVLKTGVKGQVFLSQRQCSHLMVAAFFCAFPKRSHHSHEYSELNPVNFNRLFECQPEVRSKILTQF